MSKMTLEQRVMALETELVTLRKQLPPQFSTNPPRDAGVTAKRSRTAAKKKSLVDHVSGAFANDPIFLEAMRLGREYRESLRPDAKPKTRRKSADARPRH